MKKKTSIIISDGEIMQYLKDRGVTVPVDAKLSFQEEPFNNLSVSWEEEARYNGPIGESLLEELRYFCDHDKRITAIKNLRYHTGWGLKDAKDFIDNHFPR